LPIIKILRKYLNIKIVKALIPFTSFWYFFDIVEFLWISQISYFFPNCSFLPKCLGLFAGQNTLCDAQEFSMYVTKKGRVVWCHFPDIRVCFSNVPAQTCYFSSHIYQLVESIKQMTNFHSVHIRHRKSKCHPRNKKIHLT